MGVAVAADDDLGAGRRPGRWSSEAWAHRLSPQAYVGTRRGGLLALACVLAIALLLVQDLRVYPGYSSLPVSLLFVVVAGWFLGKRALAVVSVAAGAVQLIEVVVGNQGWLSAVVGVALIVLVGATARLTATRTERQRLLTTQERRVEELNFLLETAEGLASTLDADSIIAAAVGATAVAVSRQARGRPARAAYHELLDDLLVIRHESGDMGTIGFEYSITRNQGAQGAVKTGRATIVRPDHFTGGLREHADRMGLQVVLYAPVRIGDKVVGLLVAAHTDSPEVEPEELRLLEMLARLTGLAIGNAQHLSRERQHLERLKAVENLKTDLLNVASHELRGPLTVVRGYMSMLGDGSLGPLPGQSLDVVPLMSLKLTEMELLVDQMLEAAKLEENRVTLRLRRIDLRSLVHDAVTQARPLVGDDRRIELDLPQREVPVEADAERIVTVLANLLSNAIKYSPDGGDVQCTLSMAEGRARISVRDHGLGIEPDDLERLFTRFGRILTPENSSISGSGLGLYVSRELAREHGGDITVLSTPGGGSDFILQLPTANGSPPGKAQNASRD